MSWAAPPTHHPALQARLEQALAAQRPGELRCALELSSLRADLSAAEARATKAELRLAVAATKAMVGTRRIVFCGNDRRQSSCRRQGSCALRRPGCGPAAPQLLPAARRCRSASRRRRRGRGSGVQLSCSCRSSSLCRSSCKSSYMSSYWSSARPRWPPALGACLVLARGDAARAACASCAAGAAAEPALLLQAAALRAPLLELRLEQEAQEGRHQQQGGEELLASAAESLQEEGFRVRPPFRRRAPACVTCPQSPATCPAAPACPGPQTRRPPPPPKMPPEATGLKPSTGRIWPTWSGVNFMTGRPPGVAGPQQHYLRPAHPPGHVASHAVAQGPARSPAQPRGHCLCLGGRRGSSRGSRDSRAGGGGGGNSGRRLSRGRRRRHRGLRRAGRPHAGAGDGGGAGAGGAPGGACGGPRASSRCGAGGAGTPPRLRCAGGLRDQGDRAGVG
jgi:hypothetical protein